MHRLPPGAATGIARNLVVALIVLVAFLAGLACRSAVAQQCTPAGGGTPCETADGVASLGDPDGSDLTVGNPFHPVTGNKYQEEQDVPPLPGFLGLEVRRHFNAAYVSAASPWGKGWSLSYDTRLHRHAGSLQIVQADGRRLVFRAPEPAGAVAGRAGIACAATAPGQGELFAEADGYRWLWPQQRELLFDSTGKLVKVRPRGGSDAEAIRIEHDPTGRIIRVTDPAGRSLTIDYDANGHLSRIDHPLGRWQYRIHADGRLETVTGPDGVVRRYRYDDPGHRSRFTALAIQAPGEAERLVAQWSYDTLGRVVRYRRGDGGLLHMDYDEPPSPSQSSSATASSSAEVVSVLTNALGARTRYTAVELAGRWRVTEIAGPGCEECAPGNVRMRYDVRGQLASRQRIGGEGVTYQRDGLGRVVRISRIGLDKGGAAGHAAGKDGAGYLLRFEYADTQTSLPSLAARPSVVPGREHRIHFRRDARGNLLEFLESGYAPGLEGALAPQRIERRTRLRYETVAGRLLLKEIDGPLPNGPGGDPSDSDITRFGYDDAGRLLKSVEEPGGWRREVVARDAAGRAVGIVSADGHRETEERLAYDHRHRTLDSRVTAWLLDATGRIDGSAVVVSSSRRFDPLGHLLHSVDAAGRMTRYRHDAVGRLLGISDARGYRSDLRRDAEGKVRVAALYQPGSDAPLRAAYYGRDLAGRLQTLLLPDGRRFGFHYDPQDRAIAIVGPDGLRLVPPSGAGQVPASTILDDFGQVLQQALPDHGRRAMRYDEAGRVVSLTNGVGTTFGFRYDAVGRLLSRSTAGPAGEEVVSFGYEGRLLVRAQDLVQSIRWRHDAAGRIVETSTTLAGLPGPPLRLARTYDPETGLPKAHGLADGRSLVIRRLAAAEGSAPRQLELRSAFWRVAEDLLRRWLPQGIAGHVAQFLPGTIVARDIEVHPFDGLLAFTYGNGSVMRRTVDPAGRIVGLFGGRPDRPVGHWRYDYRDGMRVQSIESLAAPPGPNAERRQRFTYDGAGRLLAQAHASPLSAPSATPAKPAPSATPAQREVMPVPEARHSSDADLAFDMAGRVLADGRFAYAYSARGQVSTVTDLQQGRLVASYAYNHRGERVRKTVHAADGTAATTTYFLWDEGRLAAEIAANGSLVAQYLALDDGRGSLPIARLQAAGRSGIGSGEGAKDRDSTGGAKRTARGQEILAIHSDHRGAPYAMTDARGDIVWHAVLAASGAATSVRGVPGLAMNLRLPGQYFDAETGLHDNRHRTYDPRRGRYLQPDPLGYPGGPDAYVYAGGDPVNRVDPLGLYEIDVHYYMTFFLGVTAGLDPQEARIVALAAQYVDHNPLTRPVDTTHVGTTVTSLLDNQPQLLGYHFVLSGADGRTLPQYRNTRLDIVDSPQLANLLAASRAVGIGRNASLQFLGEYLHALADTYSHRDARNRPYDALVLGCGLGHGLDGHEPDLTYDGFPTWTGGSGVTVPIGRTPWRREARTLAMELDLHGVLLAVGDPARARAAGEIEATLREFNALRENESTPGGFSQKIDLLQSRLAALGYGHLDLRNEDLYGYSARDARTNRLVFLRHQENGTPFREEDFPGVCLDGGDRCRTR